MSEFSDIPRDIGPADLPPGETVLWRGKPDWRHLALDAFCAPWVTLYFVGIGTWHLATTLHDGGTRAQALVAASAVLIPLAASLALVSLLAWLSARATVFTVTDRRIVLCYGVALPALINVPLHTIEALRVRRGFAGCGDLALTLPRAGRLSFHQLWPYARPWHLFPAAPMLRSVPGAAAVSVLVAGAVKAAAEREALQAGAPAAAPASLPEHQPAGAPEAAGGATPRPAAAAA